MTITEDFTFCTPVKTRADFYLRKAKASATPCLRVLATNIAGLTQRAGVILSEAVYS